MNTSAVGRRLATALGALTIVLVLPQLASAQANSLFPDIYIKRQRPCPGLEDPRYQHIRESYYGHFPTCWRRFPPGWGCPSPDAPNWAAELQRLPLDVPQDLVPAAEGNEGAAAQPRIDDPFSRNRPRQGAGMPELPPDERVFPGEGQADPNAATPPARPEAAPGVTPDTDRPSAFLTPTPGEIGDAVAPPLAPPASSLPSATLESIPAPPSASTADGVIPTTVQESQPRRGLFSGFMARVRRR